MSVCSCEMPTELVQTLKFSQRGKGGKCLCSLEKARVGCAVRFEYERTGARHERVLFIEENQNIAKLAYSANSLTHQCFLPVSTAG